MTCQGQRHAGYSPHKHGVTVGAVAENKDWRGEPWPPADDRHGLNAYRSTHVQLCIQTSGQHVPLPHRVHQFDGRCSRLQHKFCHFNLKNRLNTNEQIRSERSINWGWFLLHPRWPSYPPVCEKMLGNIQKQRQCQLFGHTTAQKLKGHRFDPQQRPWRHSQTQTPGSLHLWGILGGKNEQNLSCFNVFFFCCNCAFPSRGARFDFLNLVRCRWNERCLRSVRVRFGCSLSPHLGSAYWEQSNGGDVDNGA